METGYINAVHNNEDHSISALAADTSRLINIDKTVSVIYQRKESRLLIKYEAVNYTCIDTLSIMEDFIRGRGDLPKHRAEVLDRIYIRFGWLDKTLGQLYWVPFKVLVQKFVDKELVGTELGKFKEICKVLSLSIREARTLHEQKSTGWKYNPTTRLTKALTSKKELENV